MENLKLAFIAFLVVFGISSVSAQSVNKDSDYYGEIGYTTTHFKNDKNGFSIKPKLARLIIGKEFDKNLAVEGAYAFTTSKDSDVVGSVKYTGKVSSYGVYLKPKMEIAEDVEAFARIGALHTEYSDEAGTANKNRLSYGIGMQAKLTKDIYGQVDYINYYKQNGVTANGFTISVGTRF